MYKSLDALREHLKASPAEDKDGEAVAYIMSQPRGYLVDLLTNAGDLHSDNTGEEHVIGDFQDAVSFALELMNEAQREEFARRILKENTELFMLLDQFA